MKESALSLPSPNWFSNGATSVSKDGLLYAFAAKNVIVVINVHTHQVQCLLHGHKKRVNCVRFCDEHRLVSGGNDRCIRLWDSNTGTCTKTNYKQSANMTSIDTFSRSAIADVVIGDGQGQLTTWLYDSGRKPKKIAWKGVAGITTVLVVPGTDETVVVGGEDGGITFVDIKNEYAVKQWHIGRHPLQSLKWIDNVPNQKPVAAHHIEIKIHTESVDSRKRIALDLALQFPQSRRQILVVGTKEGQIQLWSYQATNKDLILLTNFCLPDEPRQSSRAHPWIVLAAFFQNYSLSDLSAIDANILTSFYGIWWVWKLRISSDMTRVIESIEPLRLPRFHNRILFTIDVVPSVSDNDINLLTTSMDRNIVVSKLPYDGDWGRLESVASWSTLGGEISCIDTSFDGTIAVGCADKTIRVLSLSGEESLSAVKGDLKWRGISSRVTAIQWCPGTSCVLAFGCRDGLVGLIGDRDRFYCYSCRHSGIVKKLQWIKSERIGDLTGGYELLSLGTEGTLIQWPSVYETDWKGAEEDVKDKDRQKRGSACIDDPIHINELLETARIFLKPVTFAVSHSGMSLVVGTEDGAVHLSNLSNNIKEAAIVSRLQLKLGENIASEWHPCHMNLFLLSSRTSFYVVQSDDRNQSMEVLAQHSTPDLTEVRWAAENTLSVYTLHTGHYVQMWDVSIMTPAPIFRIDSLLCGGLSTFVTYPVLKNTLLIGSAADFFLKIRHGSRGEEECTLAESATETDRSVRKDLSSESKLSNLVTEAKISDKIELKIDKELPEQARLEIVNTRSEAEAIKRTGKRKHSTLRSRSLISLSKVPETDVDLIAAIQNQPSNICSQCPISDTVDSETLLKDTSKWRSFCKRTRAKVADIDRYLVNLNDCHKKLDQKTAEDLALRYLWIHEYSKAEEVLFSNNAMSGEFIPFFVPSGKTFYRSVVAKYISYLQSVGETHLAAAHLLALEKPQQAVDVYKNANMLHEAICLGNVSFLEVDERTQNVCFDGTFQSKRSE